MKKTAVNPFATEPSAAEEGWALARSIDPSLPAQMPHMNGGSRGFAILAEHVREIQAKPPRMPPTYVDMQECPQSTAEFKIVTVARVNEGAKTWIEITGLHSDTCSTEVLRLQVRGLAESHMDHFKKLEGIVLPKPDRVLIQDFRVLGFCAVYLTPYEALRFLLNNQRQRPLRLRAVERYYSLVQEGNWILISQGIGFDTNREIADGQHRLFTCLLSGVPMPILIAWGLHPTAKDYTDKGQNRTWAESNEINRTEHEQEALPSAATVASALSAIYRIHGGPTHKMANYMNSLQNMYLDELCWLKPYLNKAKFNVAGKVATAFMGVALMLRKAYPDEADAFMRAVTSGDSHGTTVRVFREYLLVKDQSAKDDYMDVTKKFVLAFKAFRENNHELTKLYGIGHKNGRSKIEVDVSDAQVRRRRLNDMVRTLWQSEPLLPENVSEQTGWKVQEA